MSHDRTFPVFISETTPVISSGLFQEESRCKFIYSATAHGCNATEKRKTVTETEDGPGV